MIGWSHQVIEPSLCWRYYKQVISYNQYSQLLTYPDRLFDSLSLLPHSGQFVVVFWFRLLSKSKTLNLNTCLLSVLAGLPQCQDSQDDGILYNCTENTADARHDESLDSIEVTRSRGRGIVSNKMQGCQLKLAIGLILSTYFTALKVLMMTRKRITKSDILPGTTWIATIRVVWSIVLFTNFKRFYSSRKENIFVVNDQLPINKKTV